MDLCLFAGDAFEALVRLGPDPMSFVYLRPGCGDATIRRLQAAAKLDLGEELLEAYLRLLRITNGVQINGAYFKEAENLVLENFRPPDIAPESRRFPVVLVRGCDEKDERFTLYTCTQLTLFSAGCAGFSYIKSYEVSGRAAHVSSHLCQEV